MISSFREVLRHRGILIGGFTALLFLNILNSAYSTVLVLIKGELSLSYTMSGALMSSFFTGYAFGQVPWGVLTDRYGPRRIMTLSLFGTAAASITFGAATDAWQIIATRFSAGLLGAGLFVPSVKLISLWYSSSERGTALGLLNIGGSIGLVLASWMSPVLSLSMGWRGTLMLLGLMGVLSSAVAFVSLRDRKVEETSQGSQSVAHVVRHGGFWMLALMQFIRLGAYYTFIAWLPIFLQEEYGLGLIEAGLAFSVFNIAGMMSNPLGGIVSDRTGEKFVILSSYLSMAAFVLLMVYVKIPMVIILGTFAIGWLINFVRSPMFTIIPRLYGSSAVGKVSGIQNTFASIGALALPFMLGYVKDKTGSYTFGWASLSALLISGSLLYLIIDRS